MDLKEVGISETDRVQCYVHITLYGWEKLESVHQDGCLIIESVVWGLKYHALTIYKPLFNVGLITLSNMFFGWCEASMFVFSHCNIRGVRHRNIGQFPSDNYDLEVDMNSLYKSETHYLRQL